MSGPRFGVQGPGLQNWALTLALGQDLVSHLVWIRLFLIPFLTGIKKTR